MQNYKLKFKNIFTFSFVILIFNLLFLIFPNVVFGQQISLSIYPAIIETTIKPGKSILIAYNIQNLSDPTILKAYVRPFSPKGNNGQLTIKNQFEGPIEFYLDNSDLQLNQPFFLKTKDKKQLLLRIGIPPETYDGDYYYSLLVETQPPPTVEGQTSTYAHATIGSNILITVTGSGKIDVKGKLSEFSIFPRFKLPWFGKNYNFFDSTDLIPVNIVIENQGKNLIKPQGKITLKGNFGEQAKYEIIPQNILSLSQRLILATPSANIVCQDNSSRLCKNPISLIISGFFLGIYKLSLSVNFGDGTPNYYASNSFIGIPFKFAFVISLVLIIIYSIFNKLKKD